MKIMKCFKIFSYDTKNKSKIWCQFHFSLFLFKIPKKCRIEFNFTKMFLGGVSICPWCVIGGDVGDGGGSSKNPPILEFHPRKNPKTILRKTQNSQSQNFLKWIPAWKKLVLGKTQIRYLCQKQEFLTKKNCLNQTIWSKMTILVNKLVVNLTTVQFDHSYPGLVGGRTKNGTERSPIYRTFPIAAN